MPEGPSIVVLKELTAPFTGKKVTEVSGNTRVEKERALNQKVVATKSWGKHFLICFKGFSIRIHFMLFGSYRINEEKATPPRLSLKFKDGVLNFYALQKFLSLHTHQVPLSTGAGMPLRLIE